MKRVLITGGRAPAALELARAFAASGATVFAADSAPCFLTRSSRAVTKAFRVPPPRTAPSAFAEAIRQIVVRERIDLVLPTCEEVFYLSRFSGQLRDVTDLFCPDFELIAELHDKWRFTRIAAGLAIDVPETHLLRSSEDVGNLPDGPSAWVFKPVFSRFAVHTVIRPQLGIDALPQPTPARTWVAQRFVAGRELCSYSVARNGSLTAHAVYEPSWRAGRGSGYYFQPVMNSMIEQFVQQLVSKLHYTGQIAFDFIVQPDGRVAVLECNPRATSGVHLFSPADRLADAFATYPAAITRPIGGSAGMLAPAMVLLGFGHALRRRKARAFAADWNAGRDVLWNAADPLPAVYLFAGLGATLLTAARRGVSPQAASTYDIEWDGEPMP